MKIGILVGHGKSQSGTYDSGAINKDLNLQEFKICKEIAKGTVDFLKGYNCVVELINYYGDKNLSKRIKYCNEKAFDVVCEIHLNAFTNKTATGTEVYYYPNDKTGQRLADIISKAISKKLNIVQRSNGIDDGGDKPSSYYGIIRETRATSILIETCFVTTDSEVKKIDALTEQIDIGKTIGAAIVESLSLSIKQTNSPTSPPPPEKKGRWCIGNFNESTKNRKDIAILLEQAKTIGYGIWYEEIK